MPPRRSGRLTTSVKPDYTEPYSSEEDEDLCIPLDDDDDDDEDDDDDDDDSDDDDNDCIPHDLVALLHHALTEAMVNPEPGTEPVNRRKRKRQSKRPDNSSLQAPPIKPVDLKSLIDLCKRCEKKQYVDCFNLHDVLVPLQELDTMVGLRTVKQAVVDFIILHLQSDSINLPDMRHMIIAGPPGCGKTTVSTIIARIMAQLNLCTTETIVYGTPANMIGTFLGQTAPKTEALIRSAFGGVLVIDEASSLADGRSDQSSDSFSKSCIDTLNRMLSEHGDKFVCILAGYKTEIYRDILSINPGMDRRFSTRFEIETYTPEELLLIIHRLIQRRGATLEGDITLQWVHNNHKLFQNAGGDCLSLVDTIMMEHAKRAFGTIFKNQLTTEDIDNGLAVVKKRFEASQASSLPECLHSMYT
jgi:SpoVK/Ycf46/Vps4 family AAA+-type ATPase